MYIKTLIEERVETPVVVDKPVKKILKDARALLGDPSRWHKGAYAATELGNNQPDPLHPNAAKWCSVGAVMKAGHDYGRFHARAKLGMNDYVDQAVEALVGTGFVHPLLGVPDFNDCSSTKHSDVLAMFDRAIEACDR